MKHDHRLALLDHAMGTRFLNRRYRCEWCDLEVAPDEADGCASIVCEACARAELDRQLEEEGQ